MERKKLLVSIFLSFILITSVLGFVISFDDNTNNNENNQIPSDSIEINGIKLQKSQTGIWFVDRNGINVIFNHLPEELDEIKIPDFSFATDKIYIISDPENQDTNMDYLLGKTSLGLKAAGYKTVFACSKEENCNIDIPIKDCSNYAFYIRRLNESKAYNNDKCLILTGDDNTLNMFVDKINYKLIGVE